MKASRLVVLAAVVVGVLAPAPAHAGGVEFWSWGAAYAPGEVIDERVQLWIRPGSSNAIRRASFDAYLVPKAEYDLRPPHLPASAVHLAPLKRKRIARSVYVFRLRFVVPLVAPGTYTVVQCSASCDLELAGLIESPITVVGSPDEARAVRYAARRDARLQRQLWRLDEGIERRARRELVPSLLGLRDRLASQQARIDELAHEQRVSEEQGSSAPVLEAALSIIAIVLLSGAMVLLLRRRPTVTGQNVQG